MAAALKPEEKTHRVSIVKRNDLTRDAVIAEAKTVYPYHDNLMVQENPFKWFKTDTPVEKIKQDGDPKMISLLDGFIKSCQARYQSRPDKRPAHDFDGRAMIFLEGDYGAITLRNTCRVLSKEADLFAGRKRPVDCKKNMFQTIWSLEIVQIASLVPKCGLFTRILDFIIKHAPHDALYVECINTPHLWVTCREYGAVAYPYDQRNLIFWL